MWNKFDKLTKAIIIMAIVAAVTFFGSTVTSKERRETFNNEQQITKMNSDIRDKMIKADEEGMKVQMRRFSYDC